MACDAFEQARTALTTAGGVSRLVGSRWPEARFQNGEWWLRSPLRDDAHVGSFSIRDENGLFYDHASGEGGDFISLIALTDRIQPLEAARRILGELGESLEHYSAGSPPPARKVKANSNISNQASLLGPPKGSPGPQIPSKIKDKGGATLTMTWAYKDESSNPVMFIARYDGPLGKTFRPWHWEPTGWALGDPPGLLPLYHRDRIPKTYEKTIMVHEGEASADAAQAKLPDMICTTSAHGAKGARKTDWSCLQGHQILVAGDADDSGDDYAREVATRCIEAGVASVSIIRWPDSIRNYVKEGKTEPGGWDFANPIPEGVAIQDLLNSAETIFPEPGSTTNDFDNIEAEDDCHFDDGHIHTDQSFGPYEMNEKGLWHVVQPKVDSSTGEVIPGRRDKISGPFQILAEARDRKNGQWGLYVRWNDRDSVPHECVIPRRMAHGDCTELACSLASGGLWVHPSPPFRKHLGMYLTSVSVPDRARTADRTGWHGEDYLLPGEQFSRSHEREHLVLTLETDHAFEVSGSLEDWQTQVGLLGQGNSRLAFAISVGLSAPLLQLMGLEGGGFHYYGPSSVGKTTIVEVAGSVWGGPKYACNWNATASGVEAVAVRHSDALLILDEAGQALPKDAGTIVYALANGQGRIRAKKTLESAPVSTWTVALLSTGEITLASKFEEAGQQIKAGMDVRLADIPACPSGWDQVFEKFDGFASTVEMVASLKASTRRFYGSPIRCFLRRLVEFQESDLVSWKNWKRDWVMKVVPHHSDSQVGRVAERFAVSALAGELAIEWGVLPWTKGNASWAAETCFLDWVAQRGGTGSSEQLRSIHTVLKFIDMHRMSRFLDWDAPDDQRAPNLAGYRVRNTASGMDDYLFHPGGWEEACKGFDPAETAKAMLKEGLLQEVREGAKKRLVYGKNMRRGGVLSRYHIVIGAGIAAYMQRQEDQRHTSNPTFNIHQEGGDL